MKITWERGNLDNWIDEVLDAGLDDIAYDITLEMGQFFLNDVKHRTPVDTGRLRANWDENGNPQATPTIQNGDYTLTYKNSATNPNTKKGDAEFKVYASYVEEGYHAKNGRWIPGHWFQHASETKTTEKARSIVNRRLREWMK